MLKDGKELSEERVNIVDFEWAGVAVVPTSFEPKLQVAGHSGSERG